MTFDVPGLLGDMSPRWTSAVSRLVVVSEPLCECVRVTRSQCREIVVALRVGVLMSCMWLTGEDRL